MTSKTRWFTEARYGLFLHFGPYSAIGRGEQILFRDGLDQEEYARAARAWNPRLFDARRWAATARDAGFRYAVLTSRHHDGYCLWDTKFTDYSSAKQAPRRDFVAEFVDAFRAEGLRVGLYHSLADWRIPAYFDGPAVDPRGWNQFRNYVHAQVDELLTHYGPIDVLWFDGAWPRSAGEWDAPELLRKIRARQPGVLVNNRLDFLDERGQLGAVENTGSSASLGDFGTPEHRIVAETSRPWESCQVSTWRLWGYAEGERWRPADLLLDMLLETTEKGGNLLMNVGPDGDGRIPPEFEARARAIGDWLSVHGECVFGPSEPGDVTEFVTRGRQIRRGNNLYLVIRFWDRTGSIRLRGLETQVVGATLLTTGQRCAFVQNDDTLTISGLPKESPSALFPVIRIECDSPPVASEWGRNRLWSGNPSVFSTWARARGTSVWTDGVERDENVPPDASG